MAKNYGPAPAVLQALTASLRSHAKEDRKGRKEGVEGAKEGVEGGKECAELGGASANPPPGAPSSAAASVSPSPRLKSPTQVSFRSQPLSLLVEEQGDGVGAKGGHCAPHPASHLARSQAQAASRPAPASLVLEPFGPPATAKVRHATVGFEDNIVVIGSEEEEEQAASEKAATGAGTVTGAATGAVRGAATGTRAGTVRGTGTATGAVRGTGTGTGAPRRTVRSRPAKEAARNGEESPSVFRRSLGAVRRSVLTVRQTVVRRRWNRKKRSTKNRLTLPEAPSQWDDPEDLPLDYAGGREEVELQEIGPGAKRTGVCVSFVALVCALGIIPSLVSFPRGTLGHSVTVRSGQEKLEKSEKIIKHFLVTRKSGNIDCSPVLRESKGI